MKVEKWIHEVDFPPLWNSTDNSWEVQPHKLKRVTIKREKKANLYTKNTVWSYNLRLTDEGYEIQEGRIN